MTSGQPKASIWCWSIIAIWKPAEGVIGKPFEIRTVKLTNQYFRQMTQRVVIGRIIGQISQFVWIIFKIEELTVISGRIVDEFVVLITDHFVGHFSFTKLPVKVLAGAEQH